MSKLFQMCFEGCHSKTINGGGGPVIISKALGNAVLKLTGDALLGAGVNSLSVVVIIPQVCIPHYDFKMPLHSNNLRIVLSRNFFLPKTP